MKILHVITTINRGGAENHLFELIQGQVSRGHLVQVAYLKGDGYWAPSYKAMGVDVTHLGLRRYGDWAPARVLRGLMKRCAPDVVHAHMPPAELYTVAARFGAQHAPPLVISKHNDEPFYRGIGHRALGKLVARVSARIIAISSAVGSYVVGPALGIDPDKLVVVHYGLDPAPFAIIPPERPALLRAAWGVCDHERVIGTVARLVPQKALHVMLEGFARYLEAGSKAAKLVIVGTGKQETELREHASRLGIGERVVWAGYNEDIPAVMAAFDVFTLTSVYEGFGLVLLEAMAAGKPVLATNVSAIPEIVADGHTGLLIPPKSPAAFAEALERLNVDPNCSTYGERGRQRLIEAFSPDSMVERILAVYAACLKVA